MAPFNDMNPLKDPFKYEDGVPDSTCYGARLGCKFHSIKIQCNSHIITYPSKELCSKMALEEVGVSFP